MSNILKWIFFAASENILYLHWLLNLKFSRFKLSSSSQTQITNRPTDRPTIPLTDHPTNAKANTKYEISKYENVLSTGIDCTAANFMTGGKWKTNVSSEYYCFSGRHHPYSLHPGNGSYHSPLRKKYMHKVFY